MPGSTAGMIPTPQGIWYPRNINQREFPETQFNMCLDAEKALWEAIQRMGGLLAICPGRKWTEPPWVRMPTQGKRFSKISSIPLPPANGTDTLVTSFRVPLGYDGCIVTPVFTTDGTIGFTQGSGDLTWRLQLNQRYQKDFGAVTTYLGSMTTPYAINVGQIILQSDQLVQMFVNRSIASAGTISGGRVICAAFGWYWPR
jgi:hypothetical protein